MTTKYNKLVRDKIPDIIMADGKECSVRTLSDSEYILRLDEKLTEELNEYQESKSMEELADMLEVMMAIAAARGSSFDDVEAIRKKKADKRGGFAGRLFLTEVKSAD